MRQIKKLLNHDFLTEEEAYKLLQNITNGVYNDSQVVMIITSLMMRNITVEELKGFKKAILKMAVPLKLNLGDCIDVCGTGGDGKNTFNISTISALILAAGGYPVVKHGNYGVSSFCGSSTILEHMGYQFTNNQDNLQTQIDETNICFLHAPLFHPCLKRVSKIRQDLGVRTFFNFLGPLVNPVQPNLQLTGVFNLNVGRLYKDILTDSRKAFNVIHSIDGYDEVSLTAPVKCYSESDDTLIYPEEFSTYTVQPEELFGGDNLNEAGTIFKAILRGEGTEAQNEVVVANVALGIRCFNPGINITNAQSEARDILKSGKGISVLETVINISQK